MARSRTSKNEPGRMLINYIKKLQTMPEAYNISGKYRQYDFEQGFKSLKMVQDTFKSLLSDVLNDLAKGGAPIEEINYVNQVKLNLMKIFMSWLKYSNEKFGPVEIALGVAKTASYTITSAISGTKFTCQDLVDVVNAVFNKWVGVEPFGVEEVNDACIVKAEKPLPPVPVHSEVGYTVPLTELVTATSPEQIIEGGKVGGGS